MTVRTEEERVNAITEADSNISLAALLRFPLSRESSKPKRASGTTKLAV
jgi:hypothetical protein